MDKYLIVKIGFMARAIPIIPTTVLGDTIDTIDIDMRSGCYMPGLLQLSRLRVVSMDEAGI